ncbi:MAG: cell division protein FtsQ/DivIB [Reyranellaceae bacterium]
MPAVNDIDVRARKRAAAARKMAAPADGGRRAAASRRAKKPLVPAALRKAALALGVVMLAGGVGFGGYHSWRYAAAAWGGLRAAALAWPQHAGMTLQDVTVEGRHLVSREAVLAALDINRGDPLLRFDPQQARSRLESIEWVEAAIVERRLPDGIYVRLKERNAVALWQRGADFILIDQQGRQVRTVDPNYYGHLPLIAGAGAPEHITALSLLLSEVPVIGRRVRAAVWVGQRRWNLTLDNMVEVKLPEEDAASALKKLAELDANQQLLSRDLKSVDLRLPDRLVLQLNPQPEPPAAEKNAPGKPRLPGRTSTSGVSSGQG